MSVDLWNGDVRFILSILPSNSFDCIVTRPPYWGLRDYGVDGQIGLEPTMTGYLETMVGVCRELRRVLKPNGTFWLNIGDSYAGSWGNYGGQNRGNGTQRAIVTGSVVKDQTQRNGLYRPPASSGSGLKNKDLCMIPNRLAILLQEDGWYVRSEIIWHKPNPMPESVTDRPTSAHEKIWLLTKSARYFYDAEEASEPAVAKDLGSYDGGAQKLPNGTNANSGRNYRVGKQLRIVASSNPATASRLAVFNERWDKSEENGQKLTRNLRNVWSITTKPFKGAHFATFPPDLVERCIKAGCPVGGSVLDPFGGSGTTGMVADRLGRDATLIELNESYVEIAKQRIELGK